MFSGYCVPKIIEIGSLLTELYKNYGKVAFFETQCVLNDTTQSVAQVISCKLESLKNTAISSNKIPSPTSASYCHFIKNIALKELQS